MVIDIYADKTFNTLYEHEGESYNLELKIDLQGEKSDRRSILR